MLQENTIEAAKKNQLSYVIKNKENYQPGDIDAKDSKGNSALFYAVQHLNLDMVKLLLNYGADVNIKCEIGNTPLHLALMVGYRLEKNVEIINTLYQAGGSIRI